MQDKLFCEKIAHYASKKPKHFLQMDGQFYPEGYVEYPFYPDDDGDTLNAGGTVELMCGATVRVLIPQDTDPIVAARQLKKMAKWLKKHPELIDFAKPLPEKDPFDKDALPF
jgi:hypothetical protein